MAPLPKRTRVGKPKTKTGCVTCKKRRIKCDEAHPNCLRCISAGWDCEGYIIKALTSTVRPKPPITPRPILSVTNQISSHPHRGSPRAMRSFNYFIHNTSTSIPGTFSTPFWTSQLPLFASRHPALQNSIIAVAAIHEAAVNTCCLALGIPCIDSVELGTRHRFAVQQYTTAIQMTRKLMLQEHDGIEEVALLSCILFICFEFLHSRFDAAAVHLKNGLRVLREWEKKGSKSFSGDFRENLMRVFDRLSITSFLMDEPLSFMCSESMPAPVSPEVDDVPFISVRDARDRLDQLLLESFPKRKLCEELAVIVTPDSRRAEMALYLLELKLQLEKWNDNFTNFLQSHAHALTPQERNACHVLHRTQLSTLIWVLTALQAEEVAYDSHLPLFQAIIKHVEAQLEEMKRSKENIHDFTLETGFLSHTYFVARKCRDRKLRRKAQAILEKTSPRQEGVYKGGMLAAVAERLIEIEEEGMVEYDEETLDRGDMPSEEMRVVDTCGVAGDNIWVQDWKNGRGGIVEHELLLREEKVTFVSRPQGVQGPMKFHTQVLRCVLSESMSMKG